MEHFAGKTPAEHVTQKRTEGMSSGAEAHGEEAPGHLTSAADAARDTAICILLIWFLLSTTELSQTVMMSLLGIFGLGWIVWKGGRSAHLAWSRLERLHRLIQQEKWEIEHHRPQEREELIALYQMKGFEGKLLEEVVDVLMADNDRLLKVMLEEEMGLTLSAYEHPLKQGVGAFLGGLFSLMICALGMSLIPSLGIPIAALIVVIVSACIASRSESNRLLPAMIWSVALGGISLAVVYFLWQFLWRNFGSLT